MPFSILIADDARLTRNILKHLIKIHLNGATIIEAITGKQALEIIRSQSIDALFLDLHMPEIDGFELLKILKKEGHHLKIAVCSADFQDETIQRVKNLGASAFINKTLMREQIEPAIKNLGLI